MNKKLFALSFLLTFYLTGFTQISRPRLVVGVVVDQMRPDYLTRFYGEFGNGGFKRLMSNGYMMWNVHYNYIPTYTGPGHASIYSGTTPRFHGIIGNDIYDRETKKVSYCVKDIFNVVGNPEISEGDGMSPRRMIATNICDELKICTNNQSRVISISLKDRAAILSAGHMADYALWLDQETGNFITSTYYAQNLPSWVVKFNDRNLAAGYIQHPWTPLRGNEDYSNCVTDTSICAITRSGNKILPVFPHALTIPGTTADATYSLLYKSPFANTLLTDLAIDAVMNGNLANETNPGLLAISYSSTDVVGHLFGPLSKEVKDTYLRLDKDLERLLDILDQKVGKDNYVLFLTADHGVPEAPQYLAKQKVPAGYIYHPAIYKLASDFLDQTFSSGKLIDTLINDQFYLNLKLISEKGLDLKTVQSRLAGFLIQQTGIAFAYTAYEMNENDFTSGIAMYLQNGFQPKHSGDVLFAMEPGYFEYEDGYLVEHGSGYNYDSNVPLIWYGQNIRQGESWQLHYVTDLAPTLSMILRIKYPNACFGNPMIEITGSK
jgi:predicted AlkP superfamily pyrophosphatase or phosphodiesterase